MSNIVVGVKGDVKKPNGERVLLDYTTRMSQPMREKIRDYVDGVDRKIREEDEAYRRALAEEKRKAQEAKEKAEKEERKRKEEEYAKKERENAMKVRKPIERKYELLKEAIDRVNNVGTLYTAWKIMDTLDKLPRPTYNTTYDNIVEGCDEEKEEWKELTLEEAREELKSELRKEEALLHLPERLVGVVNQVATFINYSTPFLQKKPKVAQLREGLKDADILEKLPRDIQGVISEMLVGTQEARFLSKRNPKDDDFVSAVMSKVATKAELKKLSETIEDDIIEKELEDDDSDGYFNDDLYNDLMIEAGLDDESIGDMSPEEYGEKTKEVDRQYDASIRESRYYYIKDQIYNSDIDIKESLTDVLEEYVIEKKMPMMKVIGAMALLHNEDADELVACFRF